MLGGDTRTLPPDTPVSFTRSATMYWTPNLPAGLCSTKMGRNDDRALRISQALVMRDDVRHALAIGPSSAMEDRTIDITTTGRSSGRPRRIEIVFYRIGDSIYLVGSRHHVVGIGWQI